MISFSGSCLNLMEPSAPQEKRWPLLLMATWVTPEVDPTLRKNVFLLCSPGKEKQSWLEFMAHTCATQSQIMHSNSQHTIHKLDCTHTCGTGATRDQYNWTEHILLHTPLLVPSAPSPISLLQTSCSHKNVNNVF